MESSLSKVVVRKQDGEVIHGFAGERMLDKDVRILDVLGGTGQVAVLVSYSSSNTCGCTRVGKCFRITSGRKCFLEGGSGFSRATCVLPSF